MPESSSSPFGRLFQVGEVLFHEGQVGDEMFVIQTGSVRITKKVGNVPKTLADLGPGEFVGEMAILNDRLRTATATVVEPAQCLVLSAKTLESMITRNAEIAIRLVKKLAARLDQADVLIEILLHKDPRARVIMALVRFAVVPPAGSRRPPGPGGGRATEPAPSDAVLELGVQELSDRVGVDVALTDEVLARLRRLGLIYNAPSGGVGIPDVPKLEEFLQFLDMTPSVNPGA